MEQAIVFVNLNWKEPLICRKRSVENVVPMTIFLEECYPTHINDEDSTMYRKDVFERTKYLMKEVTDKSNFLEMGRQMGCDYKAARPLMRSCSGMTAVRHRGRNGGRNSMSALLITIVVR